jgi:hypothetical protein
MSPTGQAPQRIVIERSQTLGDSFTLASPPSHTATDLPPVDLPTADRWI